jgi:hypothetical protein
MATSSFHDMLSTLASSGAIKPDEERFFLYNYQFFEKNRMGIMETYPHSWVAALNERLYSSPTLKELENQMDRMPESTYAYIEQIP